MSLYRWNIDPLIEAMKNRRSVSEHEHVITLLRELVEAGCIDGRLAVTREMQACRYCGAIFSIRGQETDSGHGIDCPYLQAKKLVQRVRPD